MVSLKQAAFLCSLIFGSVSADSISIDNIFKRFEEINTQLSDLNGRVAELERENLEKTTLINYLQEQLEVQKEEISLLTSHHEDSDDIVEKLNEVKSKSDHIRTPQNDAYHSNGFQQSGNESFPNSNGIILTQKSGDKRVRSHGTNNRGSRIVTGGASKVAFNAYIKPHDYGPLGTGQIILFDNVLTNVGSAYHGHSGIFTAPVDGVYVIYVTIGSLKNSIGQNYVEIVKNGTHLCFIWVTFGDQSSQALVLTLIQGEEIYVKNRNANDVLLGATYSSFSGFLLF